MSRDPAGGGEEGRRFLFLQGPSSPLFAKIGRRLDARGYRVSRINISAGDWMFWRGRLTRSYRGPLSGWERFIRDFIAREGVTDVVVLGEERPHHKIARAVCLERGVAFYVVEMGYFRPDWVTFERGGMSTNSHFPSAPHAILAAAGPQLPPPDFAQRFPQKFWVNAAMDVIYNLSNVFFWFLFPFYRWHALDHPLAEYAGWLRKLLFQRGLQRASRETAKAVCRDGRPFFLFPLQIESDYQLRAHSPFASQDEAIGLVMAAFARSAPPDCRVVVKTHPFDNGLRDWQAKCRTAAERHGLQGRLVFLHDGDILALVARAHGVVTINSTVGMHALMALKPVKVLGGALFDVTGLTDGQSLEGFFRRPAPADPKLLDAFVRLATAAIQVRGNFYSQAGTDAAADAIAERLATRFVNQPDAFVDPPPRGRPWQA